MFRHRCVLRCPRSKAYWDLTATQSFSSVLVIYQIARGRAVGSQPVLSRKGNDESQHLETVVFTQPSMYEN